MAANIDTKVTIGNTTVKVSKLKFDLEGKHISSCLVSINSDMGYFAADTNSDCNTIVNIS